MSTTGAISFGVVLGLAAAMLVVLVKLMAYVSSDLEGFRRWLDRDGIL